MLSFQYLFLLLVHFLEFVFLLSLFQVILFKEPQLARIRREEATGKKGTTTPNHAMQKQKQTWNSILLKAAKLGVG